MLYFVFAVILGAAIYLIFKWVGVLGLNLFSVILVNYAVCVVVGAIHLLGEPSENIFTTTVISWSSVIGTLFISMFYLMALLTQRQGVGVSGVVSRVSLVLPVIWFYFYADESISLLQLLGITSALIAIYLIMPRKAQQKLSLSRSALPLIVFLGYGAVDICLKISQADLHDSQGSYHALSTGIFVFALAYGIVVKFVRKMAITKSSLALGALLGLVNYYSIYTFLKALKESGIPSTVIFPLNSVLLLLLAVVGSVILFKEEMNIRKWIAVGFAIIASILLYSQAGI